MRSYIEERIYHPAGMDLSIERHQWEAFNFQVIVQYRGAGKYAVVTSREAYRQLSQAGNWLYRPLKMTAMRWCRFDFETACRLAESVVDHVKVNGLTWAEWEARREKKEVT